MPCKAFNAYQRLPITHDAKRPRGGQRVWLAQGGQPMIFSTMIFGNGSFSGHDFHTALPGMA